MHVPFTTALDGLKPPTLATFVDRLTARLTPDSAGKGAAQQAVAPNVSPTLTPAMLRAALLEMGLAGDAQNLALAEAFARLGLPLTREALAEAHGALARAPQAAPLAYALARAWSLPTTPAALNALSAVTGPDPPQVAPQSALPPELMSWLALAADAGMEAESLAAQLCVMALGTGRSTEHRLAAHPEDAGLAAFRDTRTTLLRLALGSGDRAIRRGADALASHIEGQQLVNQAARRSPDAGQAGQFYFAVPLLFVGEPTLAEMRLGTWDEAQDADALPGDTPWLRATVRLATARLGRVQAEIVGTLGGALTCRLGAEMPATVRLLHRHAASLADALTALCGWRTSSVQCHAASDWTPLWHGGDTLATPRPCVDWRV